MHETGTVSDHAHNEDAASGLRPRMPVRRFDVFAEFNRMRGLNHGLDEAHAKGYGLWVAKVVASGGRRGAKLEPGAPKGEAAERAEHVSYDNQAWHVLGDEPQTDALFDREVVRRMGPEFYHTVFAPAVDEAFEEGKSYESIRDTIRKDWKPAR